MIKIIYDCIGGFFENMWYTLLSLIFLFFIKKWFFNFINKHIRTGNYYFDYDCHRYNPFKKCITCLIKQKCEPDYHNIKGHLELIRFNDDLRLRIQNHKKEIKIIVINKHLIPIKLYWNIFYRIFKNVLLCKFEKNIEPIYLIKISKKTEQIFDDEFAILENN